MSQQDNKQSKSSKPGENTAITSPKPKEPTLEGKIGSVAPKDETGALQESDILGDANKEIPVISSSAAGLTEADMLAPSLVPAMTPAGMEIMPVVDLPAPPIPAEVRVPVVVPIVPESLLQKSDAELSTNLPAKNAVNNLLKQAGVGPGQRPTGPRPAAVPRPAIPAPVGAQAPGANKVQAVLQNTREKLAQSVEQFAPALAQRVRAGLAGKPEVDNAHAGMKALGRGPVAAPADLGNRGSASGQKQASEQMRLNRLAPAVRAKLEKERVARENQERQSQELTAAAAEFLKPLNEAFIAMRAELSNPDTTEVMVTSQIQVFLNRLTTTMGPKFMMPLFEGAALFAEELAKAPAPIEESPAKDTAPSNA